MGIEIKKVAFDEIAQLQEIGSQTFAETYSSGNTKENLYSYLKEKFSADKIKTEWSDKNSGFYFALSNNRIVGYLKINFEQSQTEIKDAKALEIERIYVLKKFQGRRAGQLLYEKAMQIAKEKDIDYVWLGVWEENPKAIQFYKKNGFVEFDKRVFKLGNDEQTDIMMKLEVNTAN